MVKKTLYEYQRNLILDIECAPHKIINLALLQTLDAIGRYDVAIELLKYGIEIAPDIRVCVIGFYLSVMWNGDFPCFEAKLVDSYPLANKEYQSIINLLFAIKYRNQNKITLAMRCLENQFRCATNMLIIFSCMHFIVLKTLKKKYLDSARQNLSTLNETRKITII